MSDEPTNEGQNLKKPNNTSTDGQKGGTKNTGGTGVETPKQKATGTTNEKKKGGGTEGVAGEQNGEGQTNINQAQTIINNHFGNSASPKAKENELNRILSSRVEEGFSNRFSLTMLDVIDANDIAISSGKSSFLAESDFYQKGIDILNEYRVVVLVGTKKAGVSDIALWMAYKMKTSKEIDTIFFSQAMGSQVRINLHMDIAQNTEDFQKSIVILEEAIKKKNQNLVTFLEKIAGSKSPISHNLRAELTAGNTFLILTLDQNEVASYSGLSEKVITISVPPLSEQKKQNYLGFKLRALKQRAGISDQQQAFIDRILQEEINTIVEQLPDINDLDRLLNRLEEQLYADKGRTLDSEDLKALIQSIKNIRHWLIEDLGKSLDSWHFIFCSTLLHSYPAEIEQNVSLIEFEFFRNRLEGFLKEKSKMKEEHQEWKGLFPEVQLIRKCRIEKRKDRVTGKQILVFEQGEYTDELWQVLLSELSLNLIQIVPFLHRLIGENRLVSTAGRILGRIGEIDALQILEWMNVWANSDEAKDRVLVSYAMQGILSSNSLEYKTICETFISKLGNSNDFNQVWTAIIAYMEIGRGKLQFAIDEFAKIADTWLSSTYENLRDLRAEKSWASSKVERHELYNELSQEEFRDYILSRLKEEIYDHLIEEEIKKLQYGQQIFLSISYAITTLCKLLDPITVLDACRSWFKYEDRAVKILFLKMLLPEDGILASLNWRLSVYRRDINEMEDWHYMVRAISIGEEAMETMVGLLQDTTSVFSELEPGEAKAMRDFIINHLIDWVEASIDLPEATSHMIELLAQVTFKVKHLEKPLWQQIESWVAPKQKELKYKVFGGKVKQRIKALEAENMTSLSLSSLQRK